MRRVGVCELCGRAECVLTKHHLIPQARHANKRNKREFDRIEVKQRVAWICRPCHNHVHALFTEKTLERQYNTLDLLKAHPDVAKFVDWIKTKPSAFKPVSRPAESKGGRRSKRW
ncbi:MAG: hypothetical protein K0Q55_3346 [Verrucomicrobia bacterium]|nr:hypothetical protein [Verrucomicrobiota bacterium]